MFLPDPPPRLHAYGETYTEEIYNPAQFAPTHYTGESTILETGKVIRIAPFKRNVFTTPHRAQPGDFAEYRWIIQNADTEVWYEKPGRSGVRHMNTVGDKDLPLLQNPRPVSLETPRVWLSPVFTTPTDDDIYDCVAGHSLEDDYTGPCHSCTDEKSEALDATPLVYYLVLSTCQASEPFIHGAHFNGKQIYKLIKCGSREAVAAEAFFAAGVNGWNIVFSCVMRMGETFEERRGNLSRVDELWQLAETEEDAEAVRAFY
ncbi:hypothetical protein BDV95DRAFT_154345 [Massariosphaeria phaeospora]|uniref:Uncharacterized protein n=1 Tax=Massariosphaeria phaeospora TaxID=100035 RepID=A0A7C8IHZ8_9PLEO|nr:hypothetical protein BDV95DRAFT_154345 [Massariosphaeria phaeospora]